MRAGAATPPREPEDPQRATFLDLFFDLVFVFALFRLSQELLEHLGWRAAVQTVVLLLAVWWVWVQTAAVSDRFDPRWPPIQVLVIASMFGSFVLAAAATGAFGTRGPVFAGAYVAVQVGRALFLVIVARGDERRRPEARMLLWFGVSAPLWLAGAVVPGWARVALWALAVAVDYGVAALRWPKPGVGRASPAEFGISGEFLAERQRQFFIIALGELILVSGLAFSGGSGTAARGAAVVVAFATTVLLWRIYIYRAGALLGGAVAAASDPVSVAVSAINAHLVMIGGIVAISVGDELLVTDPLGPTRPAWLAVILGGPALFLAGRAAFEYVVFGRVSRSRLVGILLLAAVSPALARVPPLLVALAPAAVLAGIAVTDAARARRHPAEPPSPRAGRPS
jgi:low temperature requirement protein LtrA